MSVATAAGLQAIYDAALRRQRELHGAAVTTVEALMCFLRVLGKAALRDPETQRRLAELNERQVIEVAVRLQKLKSEIAPLWDAKEIEQLIFVAGSLP